jgi:hypothetical protein
LRYPLSERVVLFRAIARSSGRQRDVGSDRYEAEKVGLSGGRFRAGLGLGARVIEQGGTAGGDRKANLIEHKRERHLYGLIVFLVFALVDDGDHEVIDIE